MSVTNISAELAIEIDCTDSTSATLESVGLYGGFFRYVTGTVDDYDSKTWGMGLIADGEIRPASRAIDLSETGGYNPEGNFGFTIAGSTDIIDYINSYSIHMIGRPCRVWMVVNGNLVPLWSGMVDTYGETETGCDFACTIDFKSRHKTLPPNVTDAGDVIPVAIGKVSQSPCVWKSKTLTPYTYQFDGESPSSVFIGSNVDIADYKDTGISIIQIPWRYGAMGNCLASLLDKENILCRIGGVNKFYKCLVTRPPAETDYFIEVYGYIEDFTVYDPISPATSIVEASSIEFFDKNSVITISNDQMTDPTTLQQIELYKYENDQYVKISNIADSINVTDVTLYGEGDNSQSVSSSILPIAIENYFSDNGYVPVYGGCELYDAGNIFDRDKDTYGLYSTAEGYSGFQTAGVPGDDIVLSIGKVDGSHIVNNLCDKYYYSFDMGTDGTVELGSARLWIAKIQWKGMDCFSNEYVIAESSFSFKVQHNPDTGGDPAQYAYFVPAEYYSAEKTFDTFDSSVSIGAEIPEKVIAALKNGMVSYITPSLYGKFQGSTLIPDPFSCSLKIYGACMVGVSDIAYNQEKVFCDVVLGEKSLSGTSDVSSVVDAIDLITYDYDGNHVLPTYEIVPSRSTWPIGRTLIERKSSAEYIDELCKNAYMVGFIDADGTLTFRTWIDNVTPVYTFTDANILRGSITDWNYSPLTNVYNDIAVKCGYDYGATEYGDTYKITRINEATFPLETEAWQSYVVGQSDYATAKAAWEQAKAGAHATGIVQVLPSSIGELQWYRTEASGAIDSAWEFVEICAYWLSRQKATCKLSSPINTATLALRLADPVNVNDVIYTNRSNLLGWIAGIDVDYEQKQIDFSIQFAPVADTTTLIYRETGTAENQIVETGTNTDQIQE